jgi:hypothetical protein
MAQIGQLSHDQFPDDICYPTRAMGENVGASGGSKWNAIMAVYGLMMSEPYTPGCTGNHKCSLLSPVYTHIGIGFSLGGGQWYQSEDFAA